jgi:hypothetical protein
MPKDDATRKATERRQRRLRPWGYRSDLAQALGHAVIAHWDSLPAEVQALLRATAARDTHLAVKRQLLIAAPVTEIETSIDIFMLTNATMRRSGKAPKA